MDDIHDSRRKISSILVIMRIVWRFLFGCDGPARVKYGKMQFSSLSMQFTCEIDLDVVTEQQDRLPSVN